MAKQKIQLKQLERQVHETTFLTAEQLVQDGRVEPLKEVEKGLWQARVRLDLTYEVDVLMRGDRVQDFSCGCSRGSKNMPCPHLVAVLLVLRSFRQQQQARQRASKETAFPVLQVRTMLHRIPEADLHRFVKDWAKEDPGFSQAFKARFFTYVEDTHPARYLDHLFLAYRDGDGYLETTTKAIQDIHRLFRQVLAQAHQLLIESRPGPGYALLEYLTGLIRQVDHDRTRVLMIRSILHLLDQDDPNRELQADSERFRFLISFFHHLAILGEEDAIHHALLLIQQYSGFPEARSSITQLMKTEIGQSVKSGFNAEPLVLVYYQNLSNDERDGDWLFQLALPRMGPLFYARLAQTLLESADFSGSQRILENGQAVFPESAELLRLQIQLSWELHETSKLSTLAEKLLFSTMAEEDIAFIERYLSTPELTSLFLSLAKQLEQANTYEQHLIGCIIWSRMENWDSLGMQIIQSGSLRLLERFGDQLLRHLSTSYDQWVIRFLTTYLDKHVGPQAKQLIRNTRAYLIRQGQIQVEKVVSRAIQDRYPHRLQLLDDQDTHSTERL